ncbi:hypothetical protein HQ545_01875 [Candidatus Woesearchaeota archaeon]|nr:hypothetical protein [Candidatus Woesearchaeota archaeon]
MPDDFISLKEPEKDVAIHPGRLRRFVNHLASSAIRAEDRSVKKQEIREKIDRIRSVSLNKRSTKKVIEDELGSFEAAVREIIKDEEKILEEQKRETRQITELKAMVEKLSSKLINLGRDYAGELESKDKKVLELREALASAHIKISESGEEREKKIRNIEARVRKGGKSNQVVELEDHIKSLESRHKDLRKSGKHSKRDLDRVKKLIDKHKDKIKKLKK